MEVKQRPGEQTALGPMPSTNAIIVGDAESDGVLLLYFRLEDMYVSVDNKAALLVPAVPHAIGEKLV
jgi:hypothetical protein